MFDEDLQRLNTQASDHSLAELESDIWAGIALRARHRAVARRRISLQSAVMALSLIVSMAIGLHATRAAGRTSLLLASGLELAPSSLLLSNAR